MTRTTNNNIICSVCQHSNHVERIYRLDEFNIMRCSACRLVFLDAPKEMEVLKELYDEDYFQTRENYFFNNPINKPQADASNGNIEEFDQTLQELEKFVPQNSRLLDVGCGVGVFLCLARDKGWRVQGVDISPFAADYAKERFDLSVTPGTLSEARFETNRFDVVTMWDLIEHVADPIQELIEVKRILTPKGYLLVNTPNEAGLLKALARLFYKASLGSVRFPVKKLYHIYHLYYFTPATLSMILEKAGFRIVKMDKTLIPVVKARGSSLDKVIVKGLSGLERALGMEYQLQVIAQPVNR